MWNVKSVCMYYHKIILLFTVICLQLSTKQNKNVLVDLNQLALRSTDVDFIVYVSTQVPIVTPWGL